MARKSGNRQAPISATTNQRRNTVAGRQRMSRSSFALPKGTGSQPGKAQYRTDTLAHARNARARVAQHGTPAERRTVQRKTAAKYPSLKRSNRR